MYNKRKFNKINDKKVLHKVKKQWVTISLALFMMIGGGAVATHVNASADATNNQNQQQVSVKLGSKKGNKNTITNKAKALHQSLLSKANLNKPTANKNLHSHNQINTTHQGNLVTVNNKPAKKVNNINKIRMHKANLYHGYVYSRINKSFQNLRINHTVALHSSVSLDSGHVFGYLHSGRIVKANRMFKQFGHYGNYLRYEINLANKHTAFITGNNHFVSYVIPARNYKYYQNKANKLVKNANYKNAKKVSKKLYKLNKQKNHNFHKYANLYEMAFNAQQNHKYSVVVDYNAKRHTTNITPTSNVTSVVSATPSVNSMSTLNYNVSPAMPSYVAPVSSTSSIVMPSSSVAPKSNSTSAKSMSSSASSTGSSANSASASSNSASSSSNQPAIKKGIYNGLNYIYNPTNNSINFISGKLNVTSRGSFLNNDTTPSDIRNANAITFGNIDLNNLSDMNNMLANDQNVKDLDLGNNFNTKSVTDMGNMFQADTGLQQLTLGNNFDTSNVNNMDSMFANDGDLTSLVLPTQFNTSNINNTYNSDQSDNMQGMFHGDSDLSSLTIQSSNTKFNNDSDLNSVSDKASWTQKGTNNAVNLGDGKSHVGTWIYKPYINNNPANDILPKNINMKIVNSDVQSQVSNDVADILDGGQQKPLQQTNPQHMLGAAKPAELGAINNISNVLTSSSLYTELAKDVANGANDSWDKSDLTLSPENILGPSNESGTNMFNKTYYDSDIQNKELVRVSEENLHLISINGVGLFSDSASDIGPSDFLPNKIIDDSQSKGDRDYDGMHTIVKYSGPISINNNSTNSDIANKLVSQFGLGNISKDQLKLAKDIGLGYKYHNGNLYGILVLGPNASLFDTQTKLTNTWNIPKSSFVKQIADDLTKVAGLVTPSGAIKNDIQHVKDTVNAIKIIKKDGLPKIIHLIVESVKMLNKDHVLDNVTKFKEFTKFNKDNMDALKLLYDVCDDTDEMASDGTIYNFLRDKYYNPQYWTLNSYDNIKESILTDSMNGTGYLLHLKDKNEWIVPSEMLKKILTLGLNYKNIDVDFVTNVASDVGQDALDGVTYGLWSAVKVIPFVSDIITYVQDHVADALTSRVNDAVDLVDSRLSHPYYYIKDDEMAKDITKIFMPHNLGPISIDDGCIIPESKYEDILDQYKVHESIESAKNKK